MNIVFRIDVSSRSSNVCILIGDTKNEFIITNDMPGFTQELASIR